MKKQFITMILSAGLSSRFNGFKPLAHYKDKTFLENIIEKTHSFSDKIYVITGYQTEKIEEYFKKNNPHNIKLIYNSDYKKGMYSSFIKGILNIDLNTKTNFDLMFQPVDIPHIKKETYNKIYQKSQNKKFEILKPSFNKKGGHPLILSDNIIKKIIKKHKEFSNPKELLNDICQNYSFFNTQDRSIIEDFDHSEDIIKQI